MVDHLLPTTDMQRTFWFAYEASDDPSPPFHGRGVTLLFGALDQDALAESIALLCRAHRALCARFELDDGRLMQAFDAAAPQLETVDLRTVPRAERDAAAARMVQETLEERFALADGASVARFRLIRLEDEEAILVRVVHHIVTDLASALVLSADLWRAYADRVEGRTPSVEPSDFREFVEHERRMLDHPDAEKKRAFWRRFLEGTAVERPTRPRPASMQFELTTPFDRLLDAEASRARVSRSAIVLARFARALAPWRTGPQAVGYFTANRRDVRFERTVGCLAQWVPIRIDADEHSADVATYERAFRDAFANILPVGAIVQAVGRPRLFDLVISMMFMAHAGNGVPPTLEGRARQLATLLAPESQVEGFRVGSLHAAALRFPMRSAGQALGMFVSPNGIHCEYDESSISRDDLARVIATFAGA